MSTGNHSANLSYASESDDNNHHTRKIATRNDIDKKQAEAEQLYQPRSSFMQCF